jgi:hypothetical protein
MHLAGALKERDMIKDPAEIWDDYCEEVAPGDRSQQGAMAFAVESVSATVERLKPYVEAFRREETRADKLGTEVDDLRAQLACARKALEFYADGNNWMREAACDPNSSRFRGTNVAVEALSSLANEQGDK